MTEAKNSRNQTVTRVYPAVFITASLGGSFIFGIQQRIVAGLFFEAGNLEFRDFAVAGVAFDSAVHAGLGFQLSFGPGRQETDRGNRPILLSKRILSFLAGWFQRRVLETQFFSGGSGFFRDRDGHVVQQLVCPAPSFDPSTDPGKVFRQAQIDLAGIWFSFFPSCILSPRTEPGPRSLSLGARVPGVFSDDPDSNFLEHS